MSTTTGNFSSRATAASCRTRNTHDAAGGTTAPLQDIAYIGITPIIGSYTQCAAMLDHIGTVLGTQGIMLIFPECLAGLQEFGECVLPLMRTAQLAPPARPVHTPLITDH